MPSDWNALEAQKRRARFLQVLADTRSEELAAEAAGVSRETRRQWAKRFPEFAATYWELRGDNPSKASQSFDEATAFPADDFLRFRELTCAYEIGDDPDHMRVVRATNSWFQKDAYHHLRDSKRLVVVLPPGHIKTTMFSIEYVTWLIMRNRNVRITVLQKSRDQAQKIVRAVADRLTNNDYWESLRLRLIAQGEPPIINPLKAWFPKQPFKRGRRGAGDTWGAFRFMVDGRTSGEKDFTLEAQGPGGTLQGSRADLIIIDDLQDPAKAMLGADDTNKLIDYLNAVVLGRLLPGKQLVVLANFFTDDDFAHRVIDGHPKWRIVKYPALIGPEVDPEIPDGELRPLSPETWTTQGLAEKREEVGEERWYFTYMQEEGSFDERTFKREVLEGSLHADFTLGEMPAAVTHVFLGCDPAVAASGHCAMIVWGLDKRTKQRYLIDIFNKTGMRNWDTVIAQLTEMCRSYSVRIAVIELNSSQGSLAYNPTLERELRSMGTKIVTYQTVTGTGGRAETSNFDITTIGGLFDAGLVTLPGGGDYEDQARVRDYIDQLVKWRTDDQGHSIKRLKRDMVMGTLFAESEALLEANKMDHKLVPRRVVPSWARNRKGGRSWEREEASGDDKPEFVFDASCTLCQRKVTHRRHESPLTMAL